MYTALDSPHTLRHHLLAVRLIRSGACIVRPDTACIDASIAQVDIC
jgi:hypothetical protein